jgi:hypothetical protein
MGHLHVIEDLCSLVKLADVPHDHVKKKLLYLSLSGNAPIWFRSLDIKCRLGCELLRKAFYIKFYTHKEAYDDRCDIFNFWPHVVEHIAQAWGRLNELIRKNPCHGIPDSLILINFYVRLPQHHRDFLDNSSEGSFTNRTQQEARNLLDTIANNSAAWDLDDGNEPRFEFEYACVENFSTTILFKEIKNMFGLDPHILVEIFKSFANHSNVLRRECPKKGFKVYTEPLRASPYIVKVEKHVHHASSVIIKEYVKSPPYPNIVKENSLYS